MPDQTKKFNSVRATRLSLLLTLSLTVGIGTFIYAPLAHGRVTKGSVQQVAQAATPVSALSSSAQQPGPLPATETWRVTPNVTAAGGDTRNLEASTEKDSGREKDSVDGQEDAPSVRPPVIRLVRAVQRTSGHVKTGARAPLVRQVAPSTAAAAHLAFRSTAQPAAPLVRQAVPKIVRRPAAPVIAATSAS